MSDDQTPAPRSEGDAPTNDSAAQPAPPAPSTPPVSAPNVPSYTPPAYGAPGAPSYGAPAPDAPAYGAPAYGSPAYGAPAYGAAPYAAGGYGAAVRTNVLSIISLVASIAGFLWILPVIGPLTAVITGHISLAQIKRTGEKGRGMALAGTIVGWIGVGTFVLFFIVLIVGLSIAASQSSRYGA